MHTWHLFAYQNTFISFWRCMSAKTVLPANKLSKKNLSKAQYVSGNKSVAPVSVERF